MIVCKKCGSENVVKSGIVAGRQRFCCKKCKCNFREGDNRTNETIAAKKFLCVLLHHMGKYSFRTLGKLFQTDHTLIYRWVREFDGNLNSQGCGEIKQLEFDELYPFVDAKKENFDSTKPLTVAHGELWPGCLATIVLQFPDASVTNAND